MIDQKALAARRYLENRIAAASPVELTAMLYEGLVRELARAGGAAIRGDLEEKGVSISHAIAIVTELRSSLNHEAGGEFSVNLERLYSWWVRRMIEANLRSDAAILGELGRQADEMRQAWIEGPVKAVVSEALKAAACPVTVQPAQASATQVAASPAHAPAVILELAQASR